LGSSTTLSQRPCLTAVAHYEKMSNALHINKSVSCIELLPFAFYNMISQTAAS